ncbi:MAG: antitermination protein NusG [Chitinophagaceae bacterium]|nr:MAG: antitermination protein NusG [Chitinophagaceae bacterium]
MEKWYIIHTRSRWEKKVADCLDQKGIESYCPIKKVKRKWSDRIKTLDEPVFKACVFVRIAHEQRTAVRLTDGVMNFVYQNGKPVMVTEREMRNIRKKLDLVNVESNGNDAQERQRKPYHVYLDRFSEWLVTCIDRPKLV